MKLPETILIADAGSTKTDWSLVDMEGNEILRMNTPGINAAIATSRQLDEYFATVGDQIITPEDPALLNKISAVYYYGAGCASVSICKSVASTISRLWGVPHVDVASDMLGACRGLAGNNPGIVCILGTGSNSALYDGQEIKANTPPLGYILGDEGSGAALGKRLISDIFKGIAPAGVISNFTKQTGLDKDSVIRRVYREPAANRFLASFARYIHQHIADEYFHNLAADEFKRFLERNVMQYREVHSLPISFIGSIAVNFKEILAESLSQLNLRPGKILSSPLAGLISYHTNSLKS